MTKTAVVPVAERLGLSRVEAAELIGVSAWTFDGMVADGRMPAPKIIGARRVWARASIERAFADLPEVGDDLRERARWAPG